MFLELLVSVEQLDKIKLNLEVVDQQSIHFKFIRAVLISVLLGAVGRAMWLGMSWEEGGMREGPCSQACFAEGPGKGHIGWDAIL
ncbi:hypothetical protein E2C01_048567 [Portunus trituberculatus]|uniref:Uncharacterized protein n=1 Tax=Portunus trituberculatus TaxID=210409 RepID=A0A5B7GDS3_PORTR|nr:hypothetical protein [Portunus trituberculatus]